jgi:predicted NUDIX family NTP pyrophosphohydrolase
MSIADARRRILASQRPLIEALETLLASAAGEQKQQQPGD